LYRAGNDNSFTEIDGDAATEQVLNNSFSTIGISEITQNKKAFVNFTTNLLTKGIATVFDKEILVVEILEDVKLTREVVNSCLKLKELGYLIALDDFVFAEKYRPLLKIAEIIKVDFLASAPAEREELVDIAAEYGTKLLAEKVETKEEFNEAKKLGYSYFQGYFFKKPEILEGEDLPVYPTNYFQALNELNKPEPDFEKIAQAISQDMALSYKLLRLINSAAYGVKEKVGSIKQALVLLGIKEVEKWLDIVVMNELAEDQPTEVIRTSLIRAKLAELLSKELKSSLDPSHLFMIGLFSMLDVLMNRKLEDLVKELPIADEIKYPLLGIKGEARNILKLVIAYEEGKWKEVTRYIRDFKLPQEIVATSFLTAVDWTETVLEIN
jgi:EAL and modified HD-GYP domain-containing signal transduction protein